MGNRDQIVNGLQYRFSEVIKSLVDISGDNSSVFDTFYRNKLNDNISFYIYYIRNNFTVKGIYEEILSYEENLRNDNEIAETNKAINENLSYVCGKLLDNNNINSNPELANMNFINPLSSLFNQSISDWLKYFKDIDKKHFWRLMDINKVLSILKNEIIKNGNGFSSTDEINKSLDLISVKVKLIDFKYNFISRYNSSKDAKKLDRIYSSMNPVEGFSIFSPPNYTHFEIKNAIERLHNVIINSLNNNIFKISIIKKFASYLTIYKVIEFSKHKSPRVREKTFQKEFELYLFNNDIFPISEGQLGNARFDTFGITKDNSILYEHKQIGFSKLSVTKQSIEKIIEQSVNEGLSYARKAHNIYKFDKEVNIILFTKKPFRVEKDSFLKEGVVFNFLVVDLSGIPPSKQKPIYIDIDNIFSE